QLAEIYCTICADGRRYRPHLLMGEVDHFRVPDAIFSPENIKILRSPLTDVVNGSLGTARGSRLWGQEKLMGGKTGTSQNPHGDDHGLFVGFYPADEPEIVVCAVVEHGLHGSTTARFVKELVLRYIEYRQAEQQERIALARN
ncbi:MAG TPA: penicillin-binding transpeptidase domain-containing protein, partial [Candidatus Glassbacteria bacterium]|nr:penicillin-binding transpeptidase domain-containing protein [Candidatus Glassbacteria bacterium]